MRFRTLLCLASLFAVTSVSADALYKCVGADGISNYSGKRLKGTTCTVVAQSGSATNTPSPSPRAASVSEAAPSPPTATASQSVANVGFQSTAGSSAPAPVTQAPAKSSGNDRVLKGVIYKFEVDGVSHYTNVKPRSAAQATVLFSYIQTCYACGILSGVNFGRITLNTKAFQSEIRTASEKYGVEESVVRAIIHAESAYRPNAVSNKGAQGLMQLIPATASRFGVVDPFDPAQNIRGGVQYLSWLMKRYSSNLTLVAAAYNAGEGAVDRNGGVPPYNETRRYVERVGTLAERYRTALTAP